MLLSTLFSLIWLLLFPSEASSFAPSHPKNQRTQRTKHLFSKDAAFELQELRVQLDAMQKSQVKFQDLNPLAKGKLVEYALAIAKSSSLPLVEERLPGTTWRLALTTEPGALESLPRDATVYLKFLDSENLEYILQFSKTFGLDKLKAKSKWQLNDNLLSFTYEKITTDALGFSDLNVPFGMLKGRTNSIRTSYFDGMLWLELGTSEDGFEYVSVYVRQEEEE
jgi:hypothetical protein